MQWLFTMVLQTLANGSGSNNNLLDGRLTGHRPAEVSSYGTALGDSRLRTSGARSLYLGCSRGTIRKMIQLIQDLEYRHNINISLGAFQRLICASVVSLFCQRSIAAKPITPSRSSIVRRSGKNAKKRVMSRRFPVLPLVEDLDRSWGLNQH